MRHVIPLAPSLAALLHAAPASAAPEWLTLSWPDVAGCPTRADVEAAAERLTAGRSLRAITAEAHITVEEATGYTLHLSVDDGGDAQQRSLKSPQCAALVEAAAVILAVAAERRTPSPPRPIIPGTDDELPPGLTRAPAPPPARDLPQFGLFAHAFAGLGPARQFAPGLTAGLAITWPRVRLDVRGTYFAAARLHFADHPGSGATIRVAAGAVRGCPRLVRGTVALQLCAGLELGALLSQGFGLETIERPRSLWAAGLLAPGFIWQPLRWFALGIEVEGVAPFTRRSYAARDDPDHPIAILPVGVRLGGGLTFILF